MSDAVRYSGDGRIGLVIMLCFFFSESRLVIDVAGRKQSPGFHRCPDQEAQTFQFRVACFFLAISYLCKSSREDLKHLGLFFFFPLIHTRGTSETGANASVH